MEEEKQERYLVTMIVMMMIVENIPVYKHLSYTSALGSKWVPSVQAWGTRRKPCMIPLALSLILNIFPHALSKIIKPKTIKQI